MLICGSFVIFQKYRKTANAIRERLVRICLYPSYFRFCLNESGTNEIIFRAKCIFTLFRA